MTEETENLVLEILRRIQGDIVSIKDDIQGLRLEMTAMRHDLTSLRTMEALHHSDIATLKSRVDRIERRLDIRD